MADSKPDTRSPEGRARVHLGVLWPRPARWTDLIATHGAACAVRLMVTYDNVALQPPPPHWLGVSAAAWDSAYRYAIANLQSILCAPRTTSIESAQEAYDCAMYAFAKEVNLPVSMGYWRFAAGIIGTHSPRHPLHLNPVDTLRWKYLLEWGWGHDPRVSDYLSVGAVRVYDRGTHQYAWKAVKGSNRRLANLDARTFNTEREALDAARVVVEGQYLSPPGKFVGQDRPK